MENLNNFDMKQFIKILSKMDKKELQNNIKKANEIMNSSNRDELINELKNKMNNN